MATILTKRSNTASSVPVAGDLTNSSSGAELAVNTADKRLFTKDSGGTVVELGTNPSSLTLPNGTANGLAFLNASKVLTSGSALTFDGTSLGVGFTANSRGGVVMTTTNNSGASEQGGYTVTNGNGTGLFSGVNGASYSTGGIGNANNAVLYTIGNTDLVFGRNTSEQMRLTSTGLGIGTSSPSYKLQLNSGSAVDIETGVSNSAGLSRFGTRGSGNSFAGSFTSGKSLELWSAGSLNATLDTSGNLGLGVTPSAWTTFKALEFGTANGHSLFASGGVGGETHLGTNVYYNSGYKYANNDYATDYKQTNGVHSWHTASSGTAGNAISFTQAMTLDASGNLGVGATSGFNAISGTETTVYIKNSGANLASLYLDAVRKWAILSGSGGQLGFYDVTSGAERARIDSSGNLLVGATSTGVSSGGAAVVTNSGNTAISIGHITGTASGEWYEVYRYAGTAIGAVTQNGTTGVLYTTASDQRLKQNIQDAKDASALVGSLQVREFDWKVDGSHQRYGFVAQELLIVAPEAVHQPANSEEMMAVDYSKLVPMLVKAVQEQQALIDSLKARLDAANL
jgi:hypothetical protein